MRALDIALTPLHLARIVSGAKSFENPVLGSPALNRRGLHVARVRAAMAAADRRRRGMAAMLPEAHREHFAANGYVRWEDFLSPETFAGVTREIAAGDFERHDMRQGRTVTRRALIDDAELARRPHLLAAKNDPRLRNAVRYVASTGGEPLLTLQIVLAGAAGDADPQTMLHADTFHPIAKAWLFLRDVALEDGPFQYVPGSHLMTPERYEWEQALSENPRAIADVYARRGSLRVTADDLGSLGYGAPEPMVVRANTLVVADTHGFHSRVHSPNATTRIEIYASLRRNPYLPARWPHAGSLPGVRGRTDRVAADAMALRAKLGGKGSPWHDIGRGAVDEWPEGLAR